MPSESTDLRLAAGDTMLVVIDVQERLAPVMHADLFPGLIENLKRLGAAAKILQIPVLISEQYPTGLGPTIPEVRSAFEHATVLPKTTFDAALDEHIRQALGAAGRGKIIVAGMEAHICVYQTVRSLARDYQVHVLRDAVASRTVENFEVGLELARATGASVTSTETVLFDLVERAGTDAFRAISKLVR